MTRWFHWWYGDWKVSFVSNEQRGTRSARGAIGSGSRPRPLEHSGNIHTKVHDEVIWFKLTFIHFSQCTYNCIIIHLWFIQMLQNFFNDVPHMTPYYMIFSGPKSAILFSTNRAFEHFYNFVIILAFIACSRICDIWKNIRKWMKLLLYVYAPIKVAASIFQKVLRNKLW